MGSQRVRHDSVTNTDRQTDTHTYAIGVSQVVLVVKNLPANAGDLRDVGSIPGSGRSPGGVHGTHSNILSMERGAWWVMVHRVSESSTTEVP